jgi:hypothetical protein
MVALCTPGTGIAGSAEPPGVPPQVAASRPTRGEYVVGGVLGTAVGFGLGHAVVGEYGNMGWVFTVGELAGVVVTYVGFYASLFGVTSQCGTGDCEDSWLRRHSGSLLAGGVIAMAAGTLTFAALRIWEIIDVWWRPTVAPPDMGPTVGVMVAPTLVNGDTAGLALAVTF